MHEARILSNATAHAVAFLESLAQRPVGATATASELRDRLARPLPVHGTPAEQVLDELVQDVDGGILSSTGPRFFGWVTVGLVWVYQLPLLFYSDAVSSVVVGVLFLVYRGQVTRRSASAADFNSVAG